MYFVSRYFVVVVKQENDQSYDPHAIAGFARVSRGRKHWRYMYFDFWVVVIVDQEIDQIAYRSWR